jgi:ABC-type sugar transport system ATPase subunit
MEKIIFDKITKSYEDIIIENVNHEFTLDKSVAFVGRNGCGKEMANKIMV